MSGAPQVASLDLDRTALLVVDMQNAFCHPEGTLGLSGVDVSPSEHVYPVVRELVERFKAAGRPVIWTVQVHVDSDHGRARKRLAAHTTRRVRVSALSGTWDAQLVDELADLADDPTYVITKHRYGAFYQTRLHALLRMLGCDALVVCGATANACVETTLREAYLRDYDLVAVTDAITSVRPEWEGVAHAVWQQYFGALASSHDVYAWLDAEARPSVVALGHLLIECEDLPASEAFYVGLLGLRVRKRDRLRDDRPLTVTEQGIGLTSGRNGAPAGPIEHIALRARGVAQLTELARARGVEIITEPAPSAYGISAYLRDPDGNKIELFESAAQVSGS